MIKKKITFSVILSILALIASNSMYGSTPILSYDGPTVVISHERGTVGETVEVSVSLENNPGIISMQLDVSYDASVLQLIGVLDEEKLEGAMHSPGYSANPYTLTWMDSRPDYEIDDCDFNGVIVKLQFKLLTVADNSPITVTPYGIYDVAFEEPIHFDAVPGSVTSEAPTYTVTFVDWDGTVLKEQENVVHGAPATAPSSVPDRNGYDFAGWDKPFDNVTENMTVTAQWTAKEYTINYVLNGGTNHSNNPAKYTIESPTITLQDPTRNGYTFNGWAEGNTIASGSMGDKTFTAQWEAVPCECHIVTLLTGNGNAGTNATNIHNALNNVCIHGHTHHTVIVRGNVTTAPALTLNPIPAGKKVVWEASYSGGQANLISISGTGEFEVATGANINATGTNNNAINTNGTTVIVSGGQVRTASTTAGAGAILAQNGASVTVNGGTVENTTGNDNSHALISSGGGNVTVSSGTVRSAWGRAISLTGNGHVIVSGGTVTAITTGTRAAQRAIYTQGYVYISGGAISVAGSGKTIELVTTNGTQQNPRIVDITGGAITATTGNAIDAGALTYMQITVSGNDTEITSTTATTINATGANSRIAISGGLVRSTNTTTGGGAIYASNGASITVSGGTVANQAANNNAYALNHSGNGTVTVSGGEILAGQGRAINITGDGTATAQRIVEITGGTITATTGNAISAAGAYSKILLTGGTIQANATTVNVGGNNSVAYAGGATITGTTRIGGLGGTNAMAIEWTDTQGQPYCIGSSTNLTVQIVGATAGTAVWAHENGIDGIRYTRTANNTGFIPVSGVVLDQHDWVDIAKKDATCEGEEGYTAYQVCARCGEEIGKEVIPGGHAWGDWITITPATYFADGEEYRECSRCGSREDRTIPMLVCDCNIVTIAQGNTATSIRDRISNAFSICQHGVTHDVVYVRGSSTNSGALTLNAIPQGKKVVWQATYTGNTANLISISGAGEFEIATGATISAITGTNVTAVNTNGTTVIVSGGTVSSSSTSTATGAIVASNGANVIVSGGTVSSVNTNAGGGAIVASSGANVIVSGGMVENITGNDNSNALISSGGGDVTVSSGTVRSARGRAISVTGAGNVFVSGGTVTSNETGNRANQRGIFTAGNVYVSGGIVNVLGSAPASRAIEITGTGTLENRKIVEITGGTVTASAGIAIASTGNYSMIKLTGGSIQSNSTTSVVGVGGQNSVAFISNATITGNPRISGFGTNSMSIERTGFTNQYDQGSSTELSILPTGAGAGTAVWARENGIWGIRYTRTANNTGFIPITGINEQIFTEYTVTFDPNNDEALIKVTVPEGETVTPPTDPFKLGNRFYGWFDGNTKFNFATPITDHITLTAKWGLYGDVNDDNRVTAIDVTWFERYMAKWEGVVINLLNADVNDDGRVTAIDVTVLERFLANWEGYKPLPYKPQSGSSPILMNLSMRSSDADTPTIRMSNSTGKIGDIVNVPITIENNPGVISMRLGIDYDATKIELVNVKNGTVLVTPKHSNNLNSMPYTLFWQENLSTSDIIGNGEIAVLQFRIKKETSTTPIAITYNLDDDDIYNINWQPVNFAVVNGSISSETVTSTEIGISEIGESEAEVSEAYVSGGITLVDPVNKTVLRAYPNPVLRGTTLNLEGVAEGNLIEVYNMSGACVYRTIATENPASLILNVPAGFYIVRTNSGAIRIVVNN